MESGTSGIKTSLDNGEGNHVEKLQITPRKKQESSIKREQAVVDNFQKYLETNKITQFKELNQELMDDYFLERESNGNGKRGNGIKERTKREEIRVIRNFFKWTIKLHIYHEDLTSHIIPPESPEVNPRFFSEEELKIIFESSEDPYQNVFMFLYLTGLRTGELANLEWSDFNKNLKLLTIRIVSQDKKQRTPGNKKKSEKTLPLSSDALNILDNQKTKVNGNRYIFLNHYGNRLDNDNIYRYLKRVLKRLNINNAHPHTFRHTFASHLGIFTHDKHIRR
jgi:site-specific recombinase XerD